MVAGNQMLDRRVVHRQRTTGNVRQQIEVKKLAIAPTAEVTLVGVENPEDSSLLLASDEAH